MKAKCLTKFSRASALAMVSAVALTALAQATPLNFGTFPDNATHSNASVAAAIANVSTNVGVVYDALGQTNAIDIYDFDTLVYTGPINVSLTLDRIRLGDWYPTHPNDGGFFNLFPDEMPNIPRMGTNYYMEFTVWYSLDLTNNPNTYDPDIKPFGIANFPGPMRLLIGLGGEVYFTGDHYDTAYYVNTTPPAMNSWFSASSGKWEVSTNWAYGTSSLAFAGDLITNATTKTITIDATTVLSNSVNDCMTISNLTVTGPAGTVNTLQLTNAGTATPLRVLPGSYPSLAVSSGGGVLVTNSALQVDGKGFLIDGTVTLLAGGRITSANVVVGRVGGSSGTLTVAGGTNSLKSLTVGSSAGATGTVWVTHGQFEGTNNIAHVIGFAGVGQMTVSNGTALLTSTTVGSLGGSVGTLTVAGGTNRFTSSLAVGRALDATGTVSVTSGRLVVTNAATTIGLSGTGQMTVSNGTALLRQMRIATNDTGRGTLTIAGGTTAIGSTFITGPLEIGQRGTVWVTGGQLVITNTPATVGVGTGFIVDGRVTLTNGSSINVSNVNTIVGNVGSGSLTNFGGSLSVTNLVVGNLSGSRGTMTLLGGTNRVAGNLTLGNFDCTATGTVVVVGGNLFVTNATASTVLEVRSGTLTLSSGTLLVDKLVMTNACGNFVRTGGTLVYGTAVLDPARDDDGDGLPNGWEQQYGVDPLASTGDNGAAGDPDGDGFTNLQEFNAGTNPNDAGSVPDAVWINSASGKWEIGANWISSIPPASNRSVYVTNATTKVVTIDATTTNTPATMTITNLLIGGPAGTINTLSLTNAGAATPLRVLNAASLNSGGALLVTNSTLRIEGGALTVNATTENASLTVRTNGNVAVVGPVTVGGGVNSTGLVVVTGGQLVVTNNPALVGAGGGFIIDGTVTLTNGGSIVVSNVSTVVGNAGSGSLTVFGGSMLFSNLIIANLAGSHGTITFAGGTNRTINATSIGLGSGSIGTVWITGGLFNPTNAFIFVVGTVGSGQLILSNGTLRAGSMTIGNSGGSVGTLTVAGGTVEGPAAITVGNTLGSIGTIWVTGGTVVLTNNSFNSAIGNNGTGRMTISNGLVLARQWNIKTSGSGAGTLTVAGGTNTIFANVTLGNFFCTATGVVEVAGGTLFVTNSANNAVLEVRSGSVTLSSGTLVIDQLIITNACGHFVRTGGTLITATNILASVLDADGDGISNGYEQSHGFDALNPADANVDSDGDGFTNLQEFQAGTLPTDPASALRIVSVVPENNNVRITWQTGLGRTNALQATTGLAGEYSTNNFAAIFTVTNTVGTATNYLDVGAGTNSPARYYRVRLVP